MDYDKLIDAVKLCGSTPKVDQCKQCAYWAGGDMCKCIPKMTADAATAIETLRAELARVTAERDGAIKDLKKWNICATCGHYSPYGKKSNCKIKSAHISGGNWAGCSEWEWYGIKED